MMPFGFFALVLVTVYWVNRAVVLFDQLIANGQSAGVFVEFTALTLPNVIRIVLPVAAFAASLYAASRLSSESELVVARTTGLSAWRMARPVLAFGAFAAILVSILTHWLVPASIAQLREREMEISENVVSRLLAEGTFLHPAEGITFYIREIAPLGEFRDIFLSDARDPEQSVIYTARQAIIVTHDDGPKLLMRDGMSQTLDSADGRLATTGFDDFTYDIGGLLIEPGIRARGAKEMSTAELVSPSDTAVAETGASRAVLLYEGHNRFNQALLTMVASAVGFSALLVGRYGRRGRWPQIVAAAAFLIALKSADNAFAAAARRDETLWPLAYASTALGAAAAVVLLWVAERPGLFRGREEREAVA